LFEVASEKLTGYELRITSFKQGYSFKRSSYILLANDFRSGKKTL